VYWKAAGLGVPVFAGRAQASRDRRFPTDFPPRLSGHEVAARGG
jgi:hypothetical protein